MGNSFQREDVDFYSKGTRCSAWLYLPASDKKCPIIVMAHGLGGTREMRLYEYAERFAEAGYACFLFDYRNFGASDGNKRQLINVKMQLEDWNNAIEYVKKDNRIDGENLLLFGTSFSGGHVIWLSAHRNDIKATVAQCPYTDTMATVKMVSLPYILKKVPFVIADLLSCIRGYHPVMLKLSTYKGENAFMEADEETTKRFIGDAEFRNEAPARTLLEFVKYSPGKYFSKINNPIYVAVCSKDSLAPAEKTIQLAGNTKYSTCKQYDCGHFDIYLNPYFEEAINDYINFYNEILL
ncbi:MULTISPECIES: alpha/beta hydrolase [Thermoactinomyces]|jgi:uncharacterized protein|uniref:Alpha/beta fold hydrolase n=1 Tax=Thermoactinomyces vulgaris TaxID=2026 RepID=A0ABS0QHY8_THEVU|nr:MULTISPECIES: alpha/beta fold hydrolase [Thermoactinomyces]KFZ41531.1 alpha/beta hydrolase [Thermoactinomyces sp. Gus2-1]KYQ86397.1 alpha/beta hydrolase [Thermoactinomyces sp. AS95]MBA4551883.1 alpha/beta fold hydrolase [Thermoactinomyces vulgaris]MBA4597214.1 alpha/beta fold hydrolase [Thermoactinomyces vulgaris]MBH8586449.1 alpha/beta fold hydrolase [Thermoactinomyces sp. CICC 10520]